MKIKNKNNQKSKSAIILLVAVFVLVVAYVFYANMVNLWPFSENKNTSDQVPATEANVDENPDQKTGDKIKKDVLENEGSEDTSSATIQITSSSQQQDVIIIRTLISIVTTQGRCELIITRQNETILRTVDVQPLSSSSTCRGFDIPLSELSPGEWSVRISYIDSTGLSSTANSKIIVRQEP